MQKTKQRSIKPSELLKKAKGYLSNSYSGENYSYVCPCVSSAKNNLIIYENYSSSSCQRSADFIFSYIDNLLEDCNSLELWLSIQNIPDFPRLTSLYTHLDHQKKLQETRHAWVDWMIKDLESQGL